MSGRCSRYNTSVIVEKYILFVFVGGVSAHRMHRMNSLYSNLIDSRTILATSGNGDS